MLFSIIVPIYNVEKYLQQCIDSALNQTFPDFELILVDDGATDDCGKIVDDYASQDERVIVIHKENGGLVSARKAGAQIARGEYVVVLDGDDWLAPDTLEKIAITLQKQKTDVVCFGCYWAIGDQHNKKMLIEHEVVYTRKDIETNILPGLIINTKEKMVTQNLWGKAFRRELYLKFQRLVDNRISMGEDGAVVFPCTCEVQSVCILPDCLYYYRINPDSMTQSKKKQIPWEGALLRIDHLRNSLPLDKYDMERQVGCYAAHAVFNVLLTQMQHRKYMDVIKEAQEMLNSHNIIPLIKKARMIGSVSEKLSQIVIANGWFFVIKLYAMLK